MYLDYFGLKELPFSIAPDPRYLYMSERHREALAHLLFGVSGQGGFVLLTGEVGTGKTTICRCFLDQVPDNTDVAFVINPKLSAMELMAAVCDELDIDYPETASIKKLNDLINEYLLSAHAVCRHTVLIIDEAQNLSVDVLEQLRLLTNLETSEKKLLQVVLLGQPELRQVLAQRELRQLSQRITARYHLRELNKQEVHAYVKARLHIAGGKGMLFSPSALNKLYRLSGGVPRLINLIADRALLGAYATQSDVVEPEHIKKAYKEVHGERVKVKRTFKPDYKYFVGVAAALFVAILFIFNDRIIPPKAAIPEVVASVSEIDSETATDNEDVIDQEAFADKIMEERNIRSERNEQLTELNEVSSDISALPVVKQSELNSEVNDTPFSNRSPDRMGRFLAFKEVFKKWGHNYPEEPFTLACDFAEMNGLRCLHKQGNWRSVLKLNRPAVLTLVNENGEQFFTSVLSVNDDVAEINYLGETSFTSIDEIDKYWLGEYSIVWKLPPYKSNLITPGKKKTEADWLSYQFARLNKRSSRGGALIEPLEKQVKRFQSSLGLEPDGIAGSMTLIELNSRVDRSVPKLKEVVYFSASK